jgi:hypothetical protein
LSRAYRPEIEERRKIGESQSFRERTKKGRGREIKKKHEK